MFEAVRSKGNEVVGPLRIASDVDVLTCSRRVAELSRLFGLKRSGVWAVEIALRELGSNVVKFASTGMLVARTSINPRGIEIVVEDDGPGIDDVSKAMIDGYTEGRMIGEDVMPWPARGLGAGLGAVSRMMDSVRIENRPEGGLRVVVFKAVTKASSGWEVKAWGALTGQP